MSLKGLLDSPALRDFEKLFVGFEEHFGRLAKLSVDLTKQVTNYPPCNVRKVDDTHYVIELALAGFAKQDVDVEMDDGKLVITGKAQADTTPDENYLFRGIANRAFTRAFVLNDRVEVRNAELVNGMLRIALERMVPEAVKPKKVDITGGDE